MYAKPLRWEIDGDNASKPSEKTGITTEVLTHPLHKMYAKVELVESNHAEQLMVLDKTGNGSILFYDVTHQDGGISIAWDTGCEETVCGTLNGLRDFAVTKIDNKVYVSGGFDVNDESAVNALMVFDGFTGEWRLLCGMKKARCNHTMVEWRGGLLVAGGQVDKDFSKLTVTCEFYDVESDRWSAFDWLPEVRCCHACVVHDDKVYISGGIDSAKQLQSNLWVYERQTSKWLNLDEDYPVVLPHSLAKHKMISHFDSLFLIGGVCRDAKGGRKATPTIISFKPEISYLGYGALSQNLEKTKYDRVTPWSHEHKLLPEPLFNSGVILAGNMIIAVGGSIRNGKKLSNDYLMTYDIKDNTVKAQRMITPKHIRGLPLDCGVVVIRKTRRDALHQLVPRNWPLW